MHFGRTAQKWKLQMKNKLHMVLYTADGDEIAAYTQFISRLCDMARDAKGYHQSRPKRTMTNTLSAVSCSDLVLSEKSIRQQERFCLEILREIQHSAMENKDKMTWCVGADRCPFLWKNSWGNLWQMI